MKVTGQTLWARGGNHPPVKEAATLPVHEIIERLGQIQREIEQLRADRREDGRNGAIEILVDQLMDDNQVGLERGMVKRCEMRDTCKALFSDFLQRSASMVGSERVSEELVSKYRSELERLRASGPRPQCARCFGEVEGLFDRHIRLARSLRVYRSDDDVRQAVAELSEQKVVEELLEPLANPQRLQILKALSSQAASFTALSRLTGLRGGNLLFHLQKLQASGMIIQGRDRGDYSITEEGFRLLRGISELYHGLKR